MNIEWPMPSENREFLRWLGFEFYGHHGRFVAAYLRRGPVAIAEHFALAPEVRDGRYVRVAFNDLAEHLRGIGVKWVVTYAPTMAPLWRRMGMTETERGWLRIRIS